MDKIVARALPVCKNAKMGAAVNRILMLFSCVSEGSMFVGKVQNVHQGEDQRQSQGYERVLSPRVQSVEEYLSQKRSLLSGRRGPEA